MCLIIHKHPQMLVLLGKYALFLLVQFIFNLEPHSQYNRTTVAEMSRWHITGNWYSVIRLSTRLMHYNLFLQPKSPAVRDFLVTTTMEKIAGESTSIIQFNKFAAITQSPPKWWK